MSAPKTFERILYNKIVYNEIVELVGEGCAPIVIRLVLEIPKFIAFIRSLTKNFCTTVKQLKIDTIFSKEIIRELIILGTKEVWQ